MLRSRQETRCSVSDDGQDDEYSFDSSASKVTAKRLFSNRASAAPSPTDSAQTRGYSDDDDEDEESTPRNKRHRTSDWPLPSNTPGSGHVSMRRNKTRSPPHGRPVTAPRRGSRFQEGSMNDRASQRPPVPYLGEDGFNSYSEGPRGRGMTRSGHWTHHSNLSVAESSIADRSDASRSSGLFRFGKSIAATFNPSNWRIWSKQSRAVVEEMSQDKVLRERRAKAEKLYQELKAAGNFENRTRRSTSQQPHDINTASLSSRRRSTSQQPRERQVQTKHDSGIDFGRQGSERRMSLDSAPEGKRFGKVFIDPPNLPHLSATSVQVEPESLLPTKRRSFHFKKPSLSNLRQESDAGSDSASHGDHHARRTPSRKDMQKQQRLIKRVSDLEGRLDAAKRHLNEALNKPMSQQPVHVGRRSKFVPGALASLPSERLLSGYVAPFEDQEIDAKTPFCGIGQAVTTDEALIARQLGVGDLEEESEPEEEYLHTTTTGPRPLGEQSLVDKTLHHSLNVQEPQPSMSEVFQPSIESALAITSKGDGFATANEANPPFRKATKKRTISNISLPNEVETCQLTAEPTSDYDSDDKSKKCVSRPRKLQKKTEAATAFHAGAGAGAGETPKPKGVKSVASKKTAIKKSASVFTPPPAKHQSKIPKKSASPPPPTDIISSFTGSALEYKKPSGRKATTAAGKKDTEDTVGDVIPPLPKMPKAVRLASGELVDIEQARKASSGGPVARSGNIKTAVPHQGKAEALQHAGVENEVGGKAETLQEGNEWPDYVF